jgi:hypothetical protein
MVPQGSHRTRPKNFDFAEVAIDKSANPARITKFYGSPVRKRDETETRPWRGDSAKADEDQTFEPHAVRATCRSRSEVDERKQEKNARNGSSSGMQPFDIEGFIRKHLPR